MMQRKMYILSSEDNNYQIQLRCPLEQPILSVDFLDVWFIFPGQKTVRTSSSHYTWRAEQTTELNCHDREGVSDEGGPLQQSHL